MGAEVLPHRRVSEGRYHQEAADGSRVAGGASAGGGVLREGSAQEDAEGSGGRSRARVVGECV